MFSYTEWALTLLKAAGHKYIKRIPYQSGGRLRYRYIYNVTHTHQGKHVLDPDHMQVGTKLMLDATSGKEVHGHITDVRGDLVSFEYDDGPRKGEVVTMGKERLAAELDKVHGISEKLSTARKKQAEVVAKLKERGASEKQIAREQKRLDALGGDEEDTSESRVFRLPAAEKIAENYKLKDGREVGTGTIDKETIKRAERGDYESLEQLRRQAQFMVRLLRTTGEGEEALQPYKDALDQIEGPYQAARDQELDRALERFGTNFDRNTRENEAKRKRFIAQARKESEEQRATQKPKEQGGQKEEEGRKKQDPSPTPRKISQEEANREKQFARLLSETEPNNVRLSNIVTVADMKRKLRTSERLKRVRPFGVAGEGNPEWSRMLKRPLDSEKNRALMRQRVATELVDYIHGAGEDALQGMREVDQGFKVMRYSLNSAEKRASDEAISEFRQAYQQRYDDLFYQNVERTEGEALDAIRSKVLEGAPEWAKEVFEEEYRSRMSTPNVPSHALKEPTAVFKGGFTFSEWASALADKVDR